MSMPTLKEARIQQKKTGTDVAYAANIAYSTYLRMEQGKPVLRETFLKVCDVLGLKSEDVTGVRIFVPLLDSKRWKG